MAELTQTWFADLRGRRGPGEENEVLEQVTGKRRTLYTLSWESFTEFVGAGTAEMESKT